MGPDAVVGLGRNFAQHLRRRGIQRQHVHFAARYLRSRARGFAIAVLVSSYGLISTVIAPIGKLIDLHGYTPVIVAVAFTPLAACAVLWFTRSTR